MLIKAKVLLSVSEFALPSPKQGSIDTYSGFSAGTEIGMQLHAEIQRARARAFTSYQSEVWVSHSFKHDKYNFEVSGRMDGIFYGTDIKIEEIKTAFDLHKLHKTLQDSLAYHPYVLQLQTYAYIHWLKNQETPELNLHLVSARNRKSIDLPVPFEVELYEEWLERRLDELAQEMRALEKRIKRRRKLAKEIQFPFDLPRPSQSELMTTVSENIEQNTPMLIQAPTGLGKTIAILYPTLKDALARGQKVFYLTPKNSQHLTALDAVERLQEKGTSLKSMMMSAKRKMCLKEEPLCNAQYCEFAQDHYTKITEHNLIEKLQKKKNLTADSFRKIGIEYQVCPYELQFELIDKVDTLICDYNYVFAPRNSNRVTKLSIGEKQKPNVVIDEIHNLPARSMEYYSPALSVVFLEKIGRDLKKMPEDFITAFQKLLEDGIAIIKSFAGPNSKAPQMITPITKVFKDHEEALREFMAKYLESDVVISPQDPVLQFFNYWQEFTSALEWVETGGKEFFTFYYPFPPMIKISCCDASDLLKPAYNEFEQIVGFSATLKPFDYYSQLTGFKSKKLKTAEFISPFPKSNRKFLVIPQVSSKYSERSRNYPRIADAISKIISVKRGNYFAFFPSFDFLDQVLKAFDLPQNYIIIQQVRGMRHEEVKQVLYELADGNKSHIIFAVQGGVFSEGIDYPGALAIGAFVVGPPLPLFDWERERIKEYYQQQYQAGLEYAYIYPAMAKAVQAAGRVIRSENDRGIIVLMDNRFLLPSFSECMPQDWYQETPQEMVSQTILKDLADFWSSPAHPHNLI